MAWYINGARVWDDLQTGNGGQVAIDSHEFEITLKKGPNLIVAEVLSGSQGYQLDCAGSDELAEIRGKGQSFDLELWSASGRMASLHLPVATRNVIPQIGDLYTGDVDDIAKREPAGRLDETTVINNWSLEPDSSKWWKGSADLSGTVWLGSDQKQLVVAIAVRDDIFRPASPISIDSGDSARIAIAGPSADLQLVIPGDGSGVYRRSDKGAWTKILGAEAKVQRVDDATSGMTWYRVAIDRNSLPSIAGGLAINVLVNDDDWGVHKQSEAWYPHIDTANPLGDIWYPFVTP